MVSGGQEGYLLALIIGWSLYGVVHSLLASLSLKYRIARRWPGLMPGYRLLFNAVAIILLLPLLYLIYAYPGPLVWAWQGVWWWMTNLLALLAIAGFFWSLRYYDGQEFLGFRQWRERIVEVEDQEHMHISPLHRFVRHPWYALGLVLVWTRDMSQSVLVSAVMITLYFIIGSWFEERKLLIYHGDAYRRYQQLVPALIPRPWRYLTNEQVALLLSNKK